MLIEPTVKYVVSLDETPNRLETYLWIQQMTPEEIASIRSQLNRGHFLIPVSSDAVINEWPRKIAAGMLGWASKQG